MFRWYFRTNLLTRILIALILGVFLGMILGENTIHIKIFGDIFLRLLNMIVLPIIAFSLIVGAASVSPKKLGSIGIKVFLFYVLITLLAVIIGLVVSLGFHIGGLEYLNGGPSISSSKTIEVNQASFIDTLLQVFPTNIFKSFAEGQVLPVIFFSLLVGIALSILKENSSKRDEALLLFNIFNAFVEIIYKIVEWILEYAPIGVFALIAYTVGSQGAGVLKNLLVIISVMYLALILLVILIYAPLLYYAKCSPFKFFSKAKEAIITAFVTRSSSGTLPISMDVAERKLGVSKS
ncbi:MAG: dicarboxylate/amino acid:cation symporter, partial [Deferribacterota bacterium]|nr:dicarboxylate/amino acid:cation symporter [Deferribacterota bacterium]